MTLTRGIRPNVQLSLRVPWEVKKLAIRYTTLEGGPFSPPYGDIHHRDQELRGLGDLMLVGERRLTTEWIAGLGVSIPTGRIERDPIVLGSQGLEHQHTQFGSGTFVPIASLQYARPGRVNAFARGEARISLYENREGFRPPSTLLATTGISRRLGPLSIESRLEMQHQTIGRWSGQIDEGTGFTNGGVRLALSSSRWGYQFTPSVYRELYSRGVHHSETFEQQTTVGMSVSRIF